MVWVTEAEHRGGRKVWLRFSDGTEGVVDLSSLVQNDHRPIVQLLADPEQFRRFRADMDTLVWDNGFDLAPEFLYDLLREQVAHA